MSGIFKFDYTGNKPLEVYLEYLVDNKLTYSCEHRNAYDIITVEYHTNDEHEALLQWVCFELLGESDYPMQKISDRKRDMARKIVDEDKVFSYIGKNYESKKESERYVSMNESELYKVLGSCIDKMYEAEDVVDNPDTLIIYSAPHYEENDTEPLTKYTKYVIKTPENLVINNNIYTEEYLRNGITNGDKSVILALGNIGYETSVLREHGATVEVDMSRIRSMGIKTTIHYNDELHHEDMIKCINVEMYEITSLPRPVSKEQIKYAEELMARGVID